MKAIILVALFLGLVGGQSFISRSGFHKDHPDKCYFEESSIFENKVFEKLMDYNEIYRPIGVCIKAKCRPDRILDLNYCQRYNVPEGCQVIKQDLTKEYPQCCEKLMCREGKSMNVREITTD